MARNTNRTPAPSAPAVEPAPSAEISSASDAGAGEAGGDTGQGELTQAADDQASQLDQAAAMQGEQEVVRQADPTPTIEEEPERELSPAEIAARQLQEAVEFGYEIEVSSISDRFARAGRRFTREPVRISPHDLTAEQWIAIRDEKELKVMPVKAGAAEE